jgi:hypothetical protein
MNSNTGPEHSREPALALGRGVKRRLVDWASCDHGPAQRRPHPRRGPTMLYPELFKSLETARWSLQHDVPWGGFERDKLTEEQALTVKMNAITEWSALPATEMFLRDNRGDSDFSAFMAVWFY